MIFLLLFVGCTTSRMTVYVPDVNYPEDVKITVETEGNDDCTTVKASGVFETGHPVSVQATMEGKL